MLKLKYEIVADKNTGEAKVLFTTPEQGKEFYILCVEFGSGGTVNKAQVRLGLGRLTLRFPETPDGSPLPLPTQKRLVEDMRSGPPFSRARVLDTVTVVHGDKTLYAIVF